MISLRVTYEDAEALEVIQKYLSNNQPGVGITRSDAIRYAVHLAAINIKQEEIQPMRPLK